MQGKTKGTSVREKGGVPFGEALQSNKQALADKLLHGTPAFCAALSLT